MNGQLRFSEHPAQGIGSLHPAVEAQLLPVLDDERGFVVNAIWLADLAKVFILR